VPTPFPLRLVSNLICFTGEYLLGRRNVVLTNGMDDYHSSRLIAKLLLDLVSDATVLVADTKVEQALHESS